MDGLCGRLGVPVIQQNLYKYIWRTINQKYDKEKKKRSGGGRGNTIPEAKIYSQKDVFYKRGRKLQEAIS